jgi:hypothetical protein
MDISNKDLSNTDADIIVRDGAIMQARVCVPWSMRDSLHDLPQLVEEISRLRGMNPNSMPKFREWDYKSFHRADEELLTTQTVYGSRIAVVWTAMIGDAKLKREGGKWARAHADENAGGSPDAELTVHDHGGWVRRFIRRHCVAYRRLMLYSFNPIIITASIVTLAVLTGFGLPLAFGYSGDPLGAIIVLIVSLLISGPTLLTWATHLRATSEPTLIRDIPVAGGWRLRWSNSESAIRRRGSMPVVAGAAGYFTLARDSTGSTRTVEDALAMMGEEDVDVLRELESMAKRPADADISITDPVPVDVQAGLSSLASGIAARNGLDVDALRGMLRDDVENHDGRLLAAVRELVESESRLAKGSGGAATATAREPARERERT